MSDHEYWLHITAFLAGIAVGSLLLAGAIRTLGA